MNKSISFFFLSLLWVVTPLHAQKYTHDSVEPITITKDMKHAEGTEYQLIITLPIGYDPNTTYKILYYLDAWWLEDLVKGCYRIKSLSDKSIANKMDDVILVGISSVGNEKAWNVQRNMDFTPSAYNMPYVLDWGGVQLNETNTGGAEKFIQFFKHNIIPTIETEYKVDEASRGILGHSFGGLWGFYAYVKHSELFSNYILLAPAVWWNQSEIFQDKTSIISKRAANMFMAMGTNEIKLMKAPMPNLVEVLASEQNEKLNLTFKSYENEDHHSILPQAIYDGIQLIYTKSN